MNHLFDINFYYEHRNDGTNGLNTWQIYSVDSIFIQQSTSCRQRDATFRSSGKMWVGDRKRHRSSFILKFENFVRTEDTNYFHCKISLEQSRTVLNKFIYSDNTNRFSGFIFEDTHIYK